MSLFSAFIIFHVFLSSELPFYCVSQSAFACARCFSSVRFVLHYTVVCYSEPRRGNPDVRARVDWNGVALALFVFSYYCISCIINCVVLSCKYRVYQNHLIKVLAL